MKNSSLILLISISLCIAACNNGSSSSGGGSTLSKDENSLTTSTGGRIYVNYDATGVVGGTISVEVRFREAGISAGFSTGTLSWNDNSDSRVRDGEITEHIYTSSGTYTISLQPDGGTKVHVGEITISSIPTPERTATTIIVCPPMGCLMP